MDYLRAEWLETLLVKHARERSIARVLSSDSEKALGPGENYTSDIIRVKMNVVLGSGVKSDKSLIVKKMTDKAEALMKAYNTFTKEIQVYSEILPQMEILMDEFGDRSGNLWPDYYGSNGNTIVFEDLKASGYELANRREGMDLDHGLLTMKSLGRLHGMGVALVQTGRLQVSSLEPYILSRNDQHINKFINGGVQQLADTMTKNWDPEWHATAQKLREIGNTVGTVVNQLWESDDPNYRVLNHGDCWINNMLFKYESERPVDMRFVDYQLVHCSSFGWDLTYFLYSSIKPAVRRQHMSHLLDTYYNSFIATLKRYRCLPDGVPKREDVTAEMDRLLVYGLAMSCSLVPLTMADPKDAMDMEHFMDESKEGVHNSGMFLNEKYTAVIKEDLKFFMEKGAL